MSATMVGLFLRHLAMSEEVGRLATASDHDLLATYEAEQGQAAFTELVRRHGPMVLRTCRRLLGGGPDAEDAFQATFVLLARQAGQLRREAAGRSSLGGWLHRVAYRTAANVLTRTHRRRVRERQAAAMLHPSPDPAGQATWNEVRPILDAELDALPDEHRRLLVACYLQGKTHAQAAAEMGLPLGSIARRLEKARTLLAERLTRRGIALSASLLAVLLGEAANGAGVPAVLLVHTVEAARLFAESAAGIVSADVARLVKGGLAQMARGSTAWSLALAGWAGLLGAGLLACQGLSAWAKRAPEGEPPVTARSATKDSLSRTDCFGDPIPPGALARLGTVRWRHATGLFRMAFTPDGSGLITAGVGGPARLWDVPTGRMQRQLGDDWDDRSLIAAFSPDGRTVAGKVRSSNDVGLWDVTTGALRHRLKGDPSGADWPLVFSPDGKTLASANRAKGALCLWDVATGAQRWAVELGARDATRLPDSLTYSPDGKCLFWASSKGGIHRCDVATGKELDRRDDDGQHLISAFTGSPDGRLFAVYGSAAGTARHRGRLWDTATGNEWSLGEPGESEEWSNTTAAFSPDGKILAIGHFRGPLRLWDTATGKELRRCEGCQSAVHCLTFSPDGKTLASGGEGVPGGQNQTVRFWDVASGREIHGRNDGHRATVTWVSFTADGKELVSGSWGGSIRIWDAVTGAQRRCVAAGDTEHFVGGRVASLTSALSADGKTIASATWQRDASAHKSSVQYRLWDRSGGGEMRRWSQDLDNSALGGFVVSPDGNTVACTNWKDGPRRVHLWEAATGKEIRTVAGSHPAFSPDGRLLATAPAQELSHGRTGGRGSFTLWEVPAAAELCTVPVPGGYVHRLLFSPDGRMVATASTRGTARDEPGVIHLWPLLPDHVRMGNVRVGPPHFLADKVPPLVGGDTPHDFGGWAFSPDGRTLALAHTGGTVRLLEVATGKERARFAGHRGEVVALAFSPDGRRLASGSRDTTVLVWDVTGRPGDGQRHPEDWSVRMTATRWADLAADDAERAGRAIWALAAAGDQAVPYLAERLRASAADVEARLAKIPQLLHDLDDDSFAVRKRARAELAMLGPAAELALRHALTRSPPSEVRRSLEQLLDAQDAEAMHRSLSGEALRGVRALEVLEQIGTREARAALEALTAGGAPASPLAQEARAALARLDRRKSRKAVP